MELSTSFERVIPAPVRERYELREVRNASAILATTNPDPFADVIRVLDSFRLSTADIIEPGGQKSTVAARLDRTFRELGWREGRHDTKITSLLTVMPYAAAGEKAARVVQTEVLNEGYKVDNVKDRVALDVEWHAKDGNLDRDVAAGADHRRVSANAAARTPAPVSRSSRFRARATCMLLGFASRSKPRSMQVALARNRELLLTGAGVLAAAFALTRR